MFQAQFTRMQRRPLKSAARTRIEWIADQREAKMRQVGPYLVGAAGLQANCKKGIGGKPGQYAVVRYRSPAAGPNGHAQAVTRVPPQWLVDRPAGNRAAARNGPVFPVNAPRLPPWNAVSAAPLPWPGPARFRSTS